MGVSSYPLFSFIVLYGTAPSSERHPIYVRLITRTSFLMITSGQKFLILSGAGVGPCFFGRSTGVFLV